MEVRLNVQALNIRVVPRDVGAIGSDWWRLGGDLDLNSVLDGVPATVIHPSFAKKYSRVQERTDIKYVYLKVC